MAPKKVSGAPLTAGEEPLTAVLLADSFTQVSLQGKSGSFAGHLCSSAACIAYVLAVFSSLT